MKKFTNLLIAVLIFLKKFCEEALGYSKLEVHNFN